MSTLYVDNLQPNLGSVVEVSGHVVKTTLLQTSTSVLVQSQTYTSVWSGSYAPVLGTSIIMFDYRLILQSSNYSNAEGRYNLILNLNGSEADACSTLGNYDYDGSGGIWNKAMISSVVSYSNTNGSAVSFDFQVKCIDSSANASVTLSEGSSKSSIIIMEIAQ